ncbi:MAG TPA: beta-ketoacyl synthase N-terminal-like domain-containing protein, partial [Actinocrinis sp.]|nr:beta-ketoacyl synthase N-terminal-like domain-containing protein [Actinocrinis sp.]
DYWLPPQQPNTTNPTQHGLTPTHHPLLTATTTFADSTALYTGRVSIATHAWLAHHAVDETVILPGTAMLELALRAGGHAGYPRVDELTLHAPLVLNERDAVHIQARLSAPDDAERRTLTVYSRRESTALLDSATSPTSGNSGNSANSAGSGSASTSASDVNSATSIDVTATADADTADEAENADYAWVHHATATLSIGTDAASTPPAFAPELHGSWPPADTTAVPVDDWYRQLVDMGVSYGPAFQGLEQLWQVGDVTYAEVALPAEHHAEKDGFGIHPALLDSALQPIAVAARQNSTQTATGDAASASDTVLLPFGWSGASFYADGATRLRVRITRAAAASQDSYAVALADETGSLVASLDSMTLRPLPELLRSGASGAADNSLFRVVWVAQPEYARPNGDASGIASEADHPADSVSRSGSGAPSDSRPDSADWAVLGSGDSIRVLNTTLAAAGLAADRYADFAALLEALDAGRSVPERVVVPCFTEPPAAQADADADGLDLPVTALRVHDHAANVLTLAQQWLDEPRLAQSRLIFATRGAVVIATDAAAGPADPHAADLSWTAVSGLVQAAQVEHPGRFALIDLPSASAVSGIEHNPAVRAALESAAPRLALRGDGVYAPQLIRVNPTDPAATALAAAATDAQALSALSTLPALDPDGTVLITGGSDWLGSLVARHLVTDHDVRHLMLLDSEFADEQNTETLRADLVAMGAAAVKFVACDTADSASIEDAVNSISTEHPLTAVIHAAGALEAEAVTALDAERFAAALQARVDTGWSLHAATRDLDLSAFVLFSGLDTAAGYRGHAIAAAGNAFLDALAQHRRDAGLAALSVGWGRPARARVLPDLLDTEETAGLAAVDTEAEATAEGNTGVGVGVCVGGASPDQASATRRPAAARQVLSLVDAAFGEQARSGKLPSVVRSLLRVPPRRSEQAGTVPFSVWGQRLVGLSETEQRGVVLNMVRATVASVLGHASAQAVQPEQSFKELGFDSLTAVTLRNQLSAATELRLPATLVFDYPNPATLAEFLRTEILGTHAVVAAPASGRPTVPATTDEDEIAIVAMACRLPGGVRSPEQLWQLLEEGADAVGGFPEDRGWDPHTLYDPDPSRPGTSSTRSGGFLYDADLFDPEFFGMSPREAVSTDPQQRLMLETSWEAFERAGIDATALRGTNTGVFAGTNGQDYATLLQNAAGRYENYFVTGASASVMSGRLAYNFGFEGPAVTVDTACSSTLVTLHLAAQALRNGECDLALAGGATIMATPTVFVAFSRQRGLATDGRCKAFSASADGAGFSEGVAMLLVERLSDARRNGHPVLAIVRGSAVNQDGASNGLTAPNGPSQQRVINQALASANLTPQDVDAVEAHGTGTTLGDPIEAQALINTYGKNRPEDQPLWLGSIKSNIGHTQAAAGAAGVIKMVLALQHGLLPQTLHVEEPSDHVDWTAGAVRLLNEPTAWPDLGRPRRAGVSSFGASGTNAHIILEQAPAFEAVEGPEPQDAVNADAGPSKKSAESTPSESGENSVSSAVPWTVSAKSPQALREHATRLVQFIETNPQLDPQPVAAALLRRAHFPHRAVAVGDSREDLLDALRALATDQPHPGLIQAAAGTPGKSVFVFPGQGSQHPGMTLELYQSSRIYRAHLDEIADALAPHTGFALLDILHSTDPDALQPVQVVQP